MTAMKRLVPMLTIGALALGVSACGDSAGGSPDASPASDDVATDTAPVFRIGVTVYGEGNFIMQGKEGMEAYAEARNIELLWNSADNDVNTQASQVEQMIAADVDAIIIVPVQYDSLAPQLRQAQAAEIPVVAVNTTIKDVDLLATSVVPDDEAAGYGNAQLLAQHLDGAGDVVIMQCVLGSSYEIARTAGMERAFAEYPDITVVAKGEAANNGRAEAADRMRNWLTAFENIDGVSACGDDPGLGAGAAGLAHALAHAGAGRRARLRGAGGPVAGVPGRALPVGHPGRLGGGVDLDGGCLPAGVPRPAPLAGRRGRRALVPGFHAFAGCGGAVLPRQQRLGQPILRGARTIT